MSVSRKMSARTLSTALSLLSFFSFPLASPSAQAAAEPLLLAKPEQGQADLALYLVSEKLDGVRAFWDGETLWTRQGYALSPPAWFTENFPKKPLDGELWMGRGQFDQLSAALRQKQAGDAEWRKIHYFVFEAHHAPGTFRERDKALQQWIGEAAIPWLKVVEQFELNHRVALERKLDEIIKAGGEGLMLHRADALYQTGRSDVLLKMKRWNDAEATVIGYRPGKGKYAGMLGALRVRTADGVEFLIGTGLSETLRRDPPPIGSIITFRYREFSQQGVPRFASFYRVSGG